MAEGGAGQPDALRRQVDLHCAEQPDVGPMGGQPEAQGSEPAHGPDGGGDGDALIEELLDQPPPNETGGPKDKCVSGAFHR